MSPNMKPRFVNLICIFQPILPINVGQILSSDAVIIAQLVGLKKLMNIHSLIWVLAR